LVQALKTREKQKRNLGKENFSGGLKAFLNLREKILRKNQEKLSSWKRKKGTKTIIKIPHGNQLEKRPWNKGFSKKTNN